MSAEPATILSRTGVAAWRSNTRSPGARRAMP